jgi:hypothetical protein
MTIARKPHEIENRVPPLRRAALCAVTIACGLALRGFGPKLGLPFLIVKYGGSLLWGAMVFWLVALLWPRASRPKIAGAAATVAAVVEFSRLWHAETLDAFRLTLAGALLLGRVFSLWNLVAYAAGIALALAIDAALCSRAR